MDLNSASSDNRPFTRLASILIQDEYVRPLVLPGVRNSVDNYFSATSARYCHDLTRIRAALPTAIQAVCGWLAPIADLSDFPHVYPTHGINGAIDRWMAVENRPIQILQGEYAWLKLHGRKIREAKSVAELSRSEVLYISNPHSSTGCFLESWQEILDRGCPIVLDGAYWGTTAAVRLPLNENVERVFVGLSKPFGLNPLRIGFSFSRKADPVLGKAREVGLFSPHCALLPQSLLREWPVDSLYRNLKVGQNVVCEDLKIECSDSVLLGKTKNPYFQNFSRGNGWNRISLSPLFQALGLGTTCA